MDTESFSDSDFNSEETSSVREDSLSVEEQNTLVKDTFKLLKNGETEIKLHEQYKNAVLILGDTGNGKSKLTQWIVGDNTKLIAKEIEEGTNEFIIININETEKSIITSDTIYPELIIDNETQVAFYDCPGFNDTRDASNEIAATYFIKKVVDHAESVKLIFAINYPSVRKGIDRHNFMKLVKHVANFIKHIENFRDSIALVVTKVDNQYVKQGGNFILVDNNKIITAVANFLIEVKEDLEMKLQDGSSKDRELHEAAVKFVSILLVRDGDQYARIGIFRRPDQPGPLNEVSLLQEEKKDIKRLIHEKLVFSEKECNDFGFTISEDCKNKIHYLVEALNASVWSCLGLVKKEILQYYSKIREVILNTIQSFAEEAFLTGDLQQVGELSNRLKDGHGSILSLEEDVRSVTNPKELAQKIKAFICNLNIDISKKDLLEIEIQGKYFNFLQVVSDRQFGIRPWGDIFREIYEYMSNVLKELQENIDKVAREVCKQIEFDFDQIAKELQNQFDEKTKLLDLKEAVVLSSDYYDYMLKIIEETQKITNTTELFQIVSDATQDMSINLPEDSVLNVMQKEKNFIFLKAISETEVNFAPSAWLPSFRRVVKHLNESKIWYKFLDGLYAKFSEYEFQANREKYNVVKMEDWGETGKPQGIVVTKRNFAPFIRNVAKCNIADCNDVENVTLTELRLDELNLLLNLTLKHRIDTQVALPSIIIKADYISIKELKAHLKSKSINGRTLLAALKSGLYQSLHVLAFNTVFIDDDIWLPGVELNIISPKWKIIGTRKISLDGADGEPHSKLKAEDGVYFGSDGEDGKPGMPGKPGGNFFGIAAELSNLDKLTVSVNGGNGGVGQDGGNGQKGENGNEHSILDSNDLPVIDADENATINNSPCKKLKDWSTYPTLTALLRLFGRQKEENTLYSIEGSSGKSGGNGGDGGIGGIGGNPGIARIFDSKNPIIFEFFGCKGKIGKAGKGGRGAKGGMNGKTLLATLNGVVNPEWVHQYYAPADPSGLNGSDGNNGHNSRGIISPEPSNNVSKVFQLIQDYKNYANENSWCRFKKALLFYFVDRINGSDEIKSL